LPFIRLGNIILTTRFRDSMDEFTTPLLEKKTLQLFRVEGN